MRTESCRVCTRPPLHRRPTTLLVGEYTHPTKEGGRTRLSSCESLPTFDWVARPRHAGYHPFPRMAADLSLSIVTPSFNTATYLGPAIQSVLSQDWPGFRY